MASQLASGDLVSDRYASALYDLAAEKKLVDPVVEDLSNLKNILKDNKELSLVVKSPLITSIDKLNIFTKKMVSSVKIPSAVRVVIDVDPYTFM